MSGKKLLLAGFAVMLLIGIPLALYLVQQQQQTSTEAQKATVLSFEPASTPTNPIQKSVGDLVPLNIVVNPGTNLVGWIRVVIEYDQTKLATASATSGGTQPFTINPSTSFSFFNGPVYSPGRIEAELSVGSDPTKALQTQVTLATVNFRALSGTGSTPTTVSYTTESQATSLGAGDQASEDVLSTTTPASIQIAGDGTTPTATPTGPGGATATPTPTTPATITPTVTTSPGTPTPTTPGGTGGINQLPVCSSLNVDRATTGTAPLSLTFTANGTDSDGTISRVSFNFGDGAPVIVTVGGGIGTNAVAVQNAHTYNNPGTYVVTATLTDNSGGTSAAGGCSQTVTVQAATTSGGTTGGGTTGGGTTGGTTDPGSIPATGPGDYLVGIGAVAGALSLLGAILFFAL